MIRKLFFSILLLSLFLSLAAQEKADNLYFFRFVAEKDMFFSPWSGNGKELERLLTAIDANRTAIESGRMFLCVISYGTDGNAVQPASEVAKIRRSCVKSELIVRGGVKEEHFVTDKVFSEPYEGQRNVVIVTLPASVEKVGRIAGAEAAARVEAYNKEKSGEAERERLAAEEKARAEQTAREQAEQKRIAAEQRAARENAEAEKAAAEQAERERLAATQEQTENQPEVTAKTKPYTLALRANLLRWATLTPDLGIEWRIHPSWGIQVNGSWTSWSWNGKDRRYALWEVAPEVRYYIGKEKRGYFGAMYKVGEFNYKFSETGKQGDIMGGGITGGYRLQLNKALALDFGIGVGYIHADYEKYTVIDGVRVRRGTENKNWWGPVNAGITLVWQFF